MQCKQLDQEGVLFEKLHQLKNERLGYLSTDSTRRNEMDVLFSSENVQLVKEKFPSFLASVEMSKEVQT